MLKVITFSNSLNERLSTLKTSAKKHNLELVILGLGVKWFANTLKLRLLSEYINSIESSELCLILDGFDVIINSSEDYIIEAFNSLNTDILFSAEANFYFRNKILQYFYWKHTPRPHAYNNFLNSGSFIGKAKTLKQMIHDICYHYNIDLNCDEELIKIKSDQYLFSRLYADSALNAISLDYRIALDHEKKLFYCTGGRRYLTYINKSSLYNMLYHRMEEKFSSLVGLKYKRVTCIDFNKKKASNNIQRIFHIPGKMDQQYLQKALMSATQGKLLSLAPLISTACIPFIILVKLITAIQYSYIYCMNSGQLGNRDIFRYQKNTNLSKSTEIIISLLHESTPFSFVDLDIQDIKLIKRLRKNKHPKNKIMQLTAYKLLSALQHIQTNYFVGIPCSICHESYHKLSRSLTKPASKKLFQATTLHHNLSYLPQILSILRKRSIYIVTNKNYDLSFLKEFGFDANMITTIQVADKINFSLHQKLQNKQFSKNSVVLVSFGALGKSLIYSWYTDNPNTTFISIGSLLDDILSKSSGLARMLLPPSSKQKLRFSRPILSRKQHLFGHKKTCQECYSFTTDSLDQV